MIVKLKLFLYICDFVTNLNRRPIINVIFLLGYFISGFRICFCALHLFRSVPSYCEWIVCRRFLFWVIDHLFSVVDHCLLGLIRPNPSFWTLIYFCHTISCLAFFLLRYKAAHVLLASATPSPLTHLLFRRVLLKTPDG